jgi:hypothetical protein
MKTIHMGLKKVALIVQSALILSACAANDDRIGSFLVSPSGQQYEFYSCEQLIGVLKDMLKNERELKQRISRAGSVASVVGGYELDYANAHGSYVAARNAGRDKSCSIPSELANDEPL